MKTSIQFPVPAHVPASLVQDYVFEDQPGADRCPYIANLNVFKLPDIFYSAGGIFAQGGSGTWVVTRADLLREIYTHPERFSSRECLGTFKLVGMDVPVIPTETDPPEHTGYRAILNRFFTPKRIQAMHGEIVAYADELIDQLSGDPGCDFDKAFATPFPVGVFLQLMRLPISQLKQFVDWVDVLFHAATLEAHVEGVATVLEYLRGVIAERRKDLGDDLLSAVITGKMQDGRPLTEDEILSLSFLLFQGGLDTVTGTMNFIFKYLAENPGQQELLRAEPDLIPKAVEELLRAFSISPSMRMVVADTEFHGVAMKKGERIFLATPISSRDDRAYDDPNLIDFRRGNSRHLAFATGVHTCAGNLLARRELRVALERWTTRMPPFRLDENNPPETMARLVWTVNSLPLRWD